MKTGVRYAGLCVLGTILPYSQFVPFLQQHGLDLRLFGEQLFANWISRFFAMDVLVSSVVVVSFVRSEGRRLGIHRLWAPILALLTVGVSLALPLFLWMREAQLERSRAPTP
jgi:hypothetical protein